MIDLEVAVADLAGLRAAHAGGADRVELSVALTETGGLTPSRALIEQLTEAALLPVHVLIRPRPGDFVYDADEVALMRRDIVHARDAGAAGVVIGALTADRHPDETTLARLADAAAELEITWHRMVDALPHPETAVEPAIRLGADRILTSGGAPKALDGVPTLRRMVEAANGRVEIMAGGGVRAADVNALAATGVDAVHLSASRTVDAGAVGPGGGASTRTVTDAELVAAVDTARRG